MPIADSDFSLCSKDYSAGIEKVLSEDYEIFSYDFDPPLKFLDYVPTILYLRKHH
jgi:hypothetical protein